MRLSANPNHSDFNAALLPSNVYIDGALAKNVEFADEEAGFLVRVVTDADGKLKLNGDCIMYEKVHGKVVIEPRSA